MFTIYIFTKTSHAVHALSAKTQAFGAMENCRAASHVYMALLYEDNNLIDAHINRAPSKQSVLDPVRERGEYIDPPVNTSSTPTPIDVDANPRAHYGDDYDDIPF